MTTTMTANADATSETSESQDQERQAEDTGAGQTVRSDESAASDVKATKRNGLRDFGRKVGEIFLVPLDRIKLAPNYRKIDLNDSDQRTALDQLKATLLAFGQLVPGLGQPDGEDVELVAGQRRWLALSELKAEGHPIEGMAVKSVKAGAEDRLNAMQLAENIRLDPGPVNNGRNFLTLHETYAWTIERIAETSGFKPNYVRDCIALVSEAPLAVQEMVAKNDVTVAGALQAVKRHGPKKAPSVLSQRAEAAKADGKTKVTREKRPATQKPPSSAPERTAADAEHGEATEELIRYAVRAELRPGAPVTEDLLAKLVALSAAYFGVADDKTQRLASATLTNDEAP